LRQHFLNFFPEPQGQGSLRPTLDWLSFADDMVGFAIINWHPLPRADTTILGQPRGPKTEMRMSPEHTRLVVEPAGFALEQIVEVLPFHYGAVFNLIAADE
jgi:hypothetical protein